MAEEEAEEDSRNMMSTIEDPSESLDSEEEREIIRNNLIKNPAIFAAKAASPRKKKKESEMVKSSDQSDWDNPPEEMDTETERDLIRQKLIDQPAIFAGKVGTLRKRRSSRKSSNNDDSDSSFDNPPTEYDTETEREMIRRGQRLNPSNFKVGQIRKRASSGGYEISTKTLLTSTPLPSGPLVKTLLCQLTPIDQSPISSQDRLIIGNLCLTEKKDKERSSPRKQIFPPSSNEVLEDVDSFPFKRPSSISNVSAAVVLRPRQLATKSNLSSGFDSTSSISKSNATWNFKKGGKKSLAPQDILEEKEENEQQSLEILKVTIDSIVSAKDAIIVQQNQPSVNQMNSLETINKPSNSQHKSIIKSSKEINESTEESNESTEKSNESTEESNESTEESNESAQESTDKNESPLRKSQMSIQREKDISIQLPVPSGIEDEISEQPDQPIICQRDQSLEINNAWSNLQSNDESTEESTDEMPSRESQMSEQIEKNIPIQQLPSSGKNVVSEQPVQPLVGPQKRSNQIQESQISKQKEKDISIQPLPIEEGKKIEKSQRPSAKEKSIPSEVGSKTSEDDDGSPPLKSQISKKRKVRKSINMPKPPLKKRSTKLQPQVVQRSKSQIALDDGISEQPDQLLIGQKKSLEINNTLPNSQSNNESTEEKTDQDVRESQMSIQQKEKVISIQKLGGKNLVSELPIHPLVGTRMRSSQQIQESQMSKQKEKDILIQPIPIQEGKKIEKNQRNKAKEKSIPSKVGSKTSKDDDGSPPLKSQISKKRKVRKSINMPKSPLKKRSTKLQPQVVQRSKSQIALDVGISEQPDQLLIGQKKSLEINNALPSSQSNNESTEEKTDQDVRESQMSIQQKEKVISIQKLGGKNLVSELPVHPLIGTRTRSSQQIQESQMSKQNEKDILIQVLPLETGQRIEKRQRNKAKENKIPSTQQTSEDDEGLPSLGSKTSEDDGSPPLGSKTSEDDGSKTSEDDDVLPSLGSKIKKKRKRQKPINMPKSHLKRGSTKLQPKAVQRLKSHIESVISSPENDSSSKIVDVRKPRERRVSQLTFSQKSFLTLGGASSTNNNMSIYSVNRKMIERPSSQGNQSIHQSIKDSSSLLSQQTRASVTTNILPVTPTAPKSTKNKSPIKKVSMDKKTNSKNPSLNSEHISETLSQENMPEVFPESLIIPPKPKPYKRGHGSNLEVLPEEPQPKISKKISKLSPKCKGMKCGPPPCSRLCPRWKGDANVLLNSNLLSEKMLKETAQQLGQKLTPAETQKLLSSINPYLENMFDELCEETPLAFGVWGFQAFKEKCKTKGFFKGKDVSDVELTNKLRNQLKDEETKTAAAGILYPKSHSKDTLFNFDRA